MPSSSKIAGIPCFSSGVNGLRGWLTVSLSKIPIIFNAAFIPEKLAALGPPPWASCEILLTAIKVLSHFLAVSRSPCSPASHPNEAALGTRFAIAGMTPWTPTDLDVVTLYAVPRNRSRGISPC